EGLDAQSRVMIMERDEAFRAASEDDATRTIIVAGAGAHFSAGHDLGSPDEIEDQKAHPVGPGIAENLKRLSELYLETCLRWRHVPKPTTAQVARDPRRDRGPEGAPGRTRHRGEPEAPVRALPRDVSALARCAEAHHRPG